MNKLYFIVYCLLFFSCNNKKLNPEEKIFKINIKKQIEKSVGDKLEIKKIFCLKKENRDFFISNISKVVFSDKYIFVLDALVGNEVYAFDIDGNFIKKLGYYGDGAPESYKAVHDILLDKKENKIILATPGKIIFYKLDDLSFINSVNTKLRIHKLSKLNDLYVGATFGDSKKVLLYFNKKFNQLNTFIDFNSIFSVMPFETFSRDSNNLYYHRIYENKLYVLKRNSVDTITFNFKGYNNFKGIDLKKEIWEPNKIKDYLIDEMLTREIFVLDDYFILLVKYDQPYYFFYDRNNNDKSFSLYFERNQDKKNELTKDYSMPSIIGSTSNEIIATIEAEELNSYDKTLFCDVDFDYAIALLKVKE